MAAAAGQVSIESLKHWRNKDPLFAAQCARAREDGAQKLVERIRLEAESGDWRAAAWLLERIEPGIYGRRVLVGGVAGSPIQIEGELKAGLAIRASVEATKLVHQALAIAAGTD
jgi:hypothetical protein